MLKIEKILNNKKLVIHLQPILSLRGRILLGFEALIRGVDEDGNIIPPAWLFREASKAGLTSTLDQEARHLAIHAFAPLWKANPKLILFVNFESTLIDTVMSGKYLFDGLLSEFGIPFKNIVLEIKEDKVKDTEKLQAFCSHYKSLGFSIALDDFGVGESSFDRLTVVQPDIIKIDRSLIYNIKNDYINQEIVRAICNMSVRIGTIVLAEGVETEEEAIYSRYLGATLIQGFWFAKPSANPSQDNFVTKMDRVKIKAHQIIKNIHDNDEKLRNKAEKIYQELHANIIEEECIHQWTSCVDEVIQKHANIEALYLMDTNAKQVGPTILCCNTKSFYEPTTDGCDHSFKEYYTGTKDASNEFYLTEEYVSVASGDICRTYARSFQLKEQQFILCIDLTK